MEKFLVLVDPIGVFQSNSMDTVERHEFYIKKLNEISNNSYKLIVLTRGNEKNYESQFIKLVNLNGRYRFSICYHASLIRYIKPFRDKIHLILAGDLWESTFTARFLRKTLKINVPIQSQLHADIGDPGWMNHGLIRRIRLLSTERFIKGIDGIRFVSEGQLERFNSKLSWNGFNVVAPVPSPSILLNKSIGKHPLPKSIGFLGRIHKDRGIDEFVRVCEILLKSNSDLQIVVAGDGPDRESFITNLKLRTTNLTYLGFLKDERLREFWIATGILINVAPSESYGRSMREALTNFIPVLAIATPETVILQDKVGNDAIEIFDPTNEVEIASKFEKLLLGKVSETKLESIYKEQEKSIVDLVNSWLKLIGKYEK